jgi:hypothetical protein
LRHPLGALAVANVDGDRRAALVQTRGGGATETARGTGHDGNATCEILEGGGRRHGWNVCGE